MKPITGKVWMFGDDINTDLIAPGRYMSGSIDEMKRHVLKTVKPEFPGSVKTGDIVVAGSNFGCGSSREEAPAVLKGCGIAAIVAVSFARIFFRNAIAIGLPVVTCSSASGTIEEGDTITLDIDSATVLKSGSRVAVHCDAFPSEIQSVLEKGGILPMLKEIAARQKANS